MTPVHETIAECMRRGLTVTPENLLEILREQEKGKANAERSSPGSQGACVVGYRSIRRPDDYEPFRL